MILLPWGFCSRGLYLVFFYLDLSSVRIPLFSLDFRVLFFTCLLSFSFYRFAVPSIVLLLAARSALRNSFEALVRVWFFSLIWSAQSRGPWSPFGLEFRAAQISGAASLPFVCFSLVSARRAVQWPAKTFLAAKDLVCAGQDTVLRSGFVSYCVRSFVRSAWICHDHELFSSVLVSCVDLLFVRRSPVTPAGFRQ
jgi:hypothetical protein